MNLRTLSSISDVMTVPVFAETPLLDRDAHLSIVRESILLAKAGRGGAIAVTGPAGLGRTSLLREAQWIARDHGLLTLPRSDAQSLGPTAVIPAISRLFAADLDERSQNDPRQVASMLAEASRSTPILVVADDAHEFDARSLRFLEDLIRHAHSEAILVMFSWAASVCPWPPGGGPIRHLRLRPLPEGSVSALFRPGLARHSRSELATELYSVIGGNPSVVAAALSDLSSAGSVDSWVAEVGPGFTRVIDRLLDTRQAAGLRLAAQSIALFGHHCRPGTLSQVTGIELAQLSEMLEELDDIGLLAPGHVLRPWVREAVRSCTDTEVIRSLHLRIAEVLHNDGATNEGIARHLLVAAEASQPWARDVLCAAAEDATRAGHHEDAVEMLNLALDWCDRPDFRLEIRARTWEVQWCANPGQANTQVQALFETARDGKLPGRWLPRLSRMAAWHGRAGDARDLIARDNATPSDEEPLLVERVLSDMWLRHVFPSVPPPIELQPDLIAGFSPALHRAHALPALLMAGNADRAATAASEVLQFIGPCEQYLEVAQAALFTLLLLERLDQADPSYQRLLRDAAESGPASRNSLFVATEATVAYWRGDAGAAVELAQRAIDLAGGQEWSIHVALPHAVRLMALIEQGRRSETVEALGIHLPGDCSHSPYGLLHLRARGLHHLSTNALQSAADDFRSIGGTLTSWHMESPGLLPWRTDLAEVYLRLGDRESSRRLAEEHLALAASRTSWSGVRAVRLLAAAESAAADSPPTRRIVVARNRKVYSTADRWMKLTPAEIRVALLATRGFTNREISEALYITVSTVEQHLTRIYRKLRIEGRARLTAEYVMTDVDDA